MKTSVEINERKALLQQINDLELKYRDKQETFWQRMFMGCTGFVAVVAPLSLQVNMSSGARICLAIAVAAIALCVLCIVPLLYSSVRWHKALFEHGQKIARGESVDLDFSPVVATGLERYGKAFATIAIFVALACLVCAGMFVC